VDLILPARLRKNVAHATQVAFTFFADVANKTAEQGMTDAMRRNAARP